MPACSTGSTARSSPPPSASTAGAVGGPPCERRRAAAGFGRALLVEERFLFLISVFGVFALGLQRAHLLGEHEVRTGADQSRGLKLLDARLVAAVGQAVMLQELLGSGL